MISRLLRTKRDVELGGRSSLKANRAETVEIIFISLTHSAKLIHYPIYNIGLPYCSPNWSMIFPWRWIQNYFIVRLCKMFYSSSISENISSSFFSSFFFKDIWLTCMLIRIKLLIFPLERIFDLWTFSVSLSSSRIFGGEGLTFYWIFNSQLYWRWGKIIAFAVALTRLSFCSFCSPV